jgi:methionine synthase II (cobalamin-independent)
MQVMFAREDGLAFAEAALDAQVGRAVEGAVARQLQAGLDIINDGEMPKPSYATYVNRALFESVKLPEGKVLVPGVIECQSTYIEHPELVAQRIGRYAHLVGRDNVMAAVDCGFGIHVGSSGVDPEVIWGKLQALAQGAAIASKRFWH